MVAPNYKARLMRDLLDTFPNGKEAKSYVATDDAATNGSKTLAMRVLESHLGKPIEEILSMDKKGVEIARYLTVSPSTVTHWRMRLGLTKPTRERIRNGNDYGSK
jgi:hypothetical protein